MQYLKANRLELYNKRTKTHIEQRIQFNTLSRENKHAKYKINLANLLGPMTNVSRPHYIHETMYKSLDQITISIATKC